MCGIFGIIAPTSVNLGQFKDLVLRSRQRGRDSSGICFIESNNIAIRRFGCDIKKIWKTFTAISSSIWFGHSRLITQDESSNQPVVRFDIIVLHNGIIVNTDEIWLDLGLRPMTNLDSEVINGIIKKGIDAGLSTEAIGIDILRRVRGVVNLIALIPERDQVISLSNNGSLFVGSQGDTILFSSESYGLERYELTNIEQLKNSVKVYDCSLRLSIKVTDSDSVKTNFAPIVSSSRELDKYCSVRVPELNRCSNCILPETMPFIQFDSKGVCNYCKNYVPRNDPKPVSDLQNLVDQYPISKNGDCIVPFSGGRDSAFSIWVIKEILQRNPVAYTYDWGMVTDIGRRNASVVCSKLGVENIIVAADIEKKRLNIKRNLEAWLNYPHFGLLSLLTAGDKHFFRHVETIKKQTGIQLNIWGINPLETTHFKSGFLGVAPNFGGKAVYLTGLSPQLTYQSKRFRAMSGNLEFFNSSLIDTLSGEYFRSFHRKTDYFHLFDYWKWDEDQINNTIFDLGWEMASDCSSSWRIGDATAAFYNYVTYKAYGFTEHDTFRSNQVREGDLTRKTALELVEKENQPRPNNIKWYFDVLDIDFIEAMKKVDQIISIWDS